MTREEAIRKLEYSKKAYQMLIDEKVDSGKLVGKDVKGEWEADTPLDEAYKSMIDALEIAIKALEHPEQNVIAVVPCGDAISREDALMCLTGEIKETDTIETIIARSGRRIRKLPPVNPQPKTGHWIRWYEQKETEWYTDSIPHCKCSECGKEYDPHSSQFIKYCNECGAKMVESQESEG